LERLHVYGRYLLNRIPASRTAEST
jgi:hypothetical protein